jgi:SpoVK/Ycf46/Vps4 family AAA+-type ATPase
MVSILHDSQSIFDRYRAMALVVMYKRNPKVKFRKKGAFKYLLDISGALPEKSSSSAIMKFLHISSKTRVGVSEEELDEAYPALVQISLALGLSFTEKLIFAFLTNINEVDLFWSTLIGELEAMLRKQATSTLAEILLLDPYKVRSALDVHSRLFESGLLEHGGMRRFQKQLMSSHFRPFREVDIHMLHSQGAWDDFLDSKFNRVAHDGRGLNFSHLVKDLPMIKTCLRNAVIKREKGIHILLYGPPGTGKTTLAREIAHQLQFELYEVRKNCAGTDESDGVPRFKAYNFGQKLGVARGDCLMLFDEMEDLLPADSSDRMHKGWICDSLESTGIPTIWTTNSLRGVDPAILRRFTFTLEVPVPPRRLRKQLLGDLLTKYSLTPGWLDRVASLDCLTPAMTQQMAALASSLDTKAGKLEAALDLWLAGRLKAMYKPPLPPVKATLVFKCELMNASLEPRELVKGLKKSGEGRLCLYGPPGTGKSAFARYMAEELGLEAIIRRGSDLRSMWVGETERNIARMFADASIDGAILILDEADSFLSGRSGRNQGWQMNEVSEFLVQLESFQGIFCATTNRFEVLDEAFVRRFDLKIKLDYLSVEQRSMMFKNLLRESRLRECLTASTRSSLGSLNQLTPGDYVTAQRRLRYSGQECNQATLLSALVHEMECKTVSQSRPIGFR